ARPRAHVRLPRHHVLLRLRRRHRRILLAISASVEDERRYSVGIGAFGAGHRASAGVTSERGTLNERDTLKGVPYGTAVRPWTFDLREGPYSCRPIADSCRVSRIVT